MYESRIMKPTKIVWKRGEKVGKKGEGMGVNLIKVY
jgi:hypothetical protein